MAETLELKQQMKEAIYEFFSDNNEHLRNIISGIMEDIALGKAIEQGDSGEYVDESVVMAELNR